ncbi:plasmid segregation protein ParM domain-containing protein [Klebsiella pneumoniae]|uniref:plasmid segregation protein ParM domain-containing protein n=1 Tax=Klebsiella pneumoniae TaxID=573 RepID=UPI003AF31C25
MNGDDGSTNVKLAWFEGDELPDTSLCGTPSGMAGKWQKAVRQPSIIRWDAEIHLGQCQRDAIPTTNVEYQYGDLNLLATCIMRC